MFDDSLTAKMTENSNCKEFDVGSAHIGFLQRR